MAKETAFPEVMGSKEVADALGVHVSNLRSIPDLPAPVARLTASRIWSKAEIDAFAVEYNRRRAARLGGSR